MVLAAGRSSRMGSAKALLGYNGRTFLAAAIDSLRDGGCDTVTAVIGSTLPEAAAIEAEATRHSALIVYNPDPFSEQVESLRLAVRSLPDASAIVVTPVDSPGISNEVVRALIEAAGPGAEVVVPTVAGRRGHPVLFGRGAMDDLLSLDLPRGARTVIEKNRDRLIEVEVGRPEILLDVDTPADYRALTNPR